ncbi:hypothetical protein SGFS_050970 [Streptomyces graminofaciens]|uniref:Uncharacterized protein n=1 Tax=Streptomyces graminofaciens TaxID=68212 RepID=A0ABN5VK56_9ACTN|nr:hypothetical protein SGFS_050970 [Streptomyces graminofaciens]
MPGESAHPAQYFQRLHVEVGALPAPRCDQPIDLVLHDDQCNGCVDMKSLGIKLLVVKTLGIKTLDVKTLGMKSLDIEIKDAGRWLP